MSGAAGDKAPKAEQEDFGEDGMPLNPDGGGGVQFMSGGGDINGEAKVEIGSNDVPKFVGLGKEELMRYANDPFWVRLRWFLFILFWIIWVGMLAGAIVIIVLAPKCSETKKGMAYYQVNLPEFVKNGEMNEFANKLSYIKDLGYKNVILSQIFSHQDQDPLDVTNFRDIDGKYGNLEKFEEVIKKYKEEGINIFLDMIPNHSGKNHLWFTDHFDYYVSKPTAQVSSSDWKTLKNQGVSAWSQYNKNDSLSYLHVYSDGVADFNFTNDQVIEEWKSIFKFWKEKGIEGVLLSGVSYLQEDYSKLDSSDGIKSQKENSNIITKLLNGLNLNAILDFNNDLTEKEKQEFYEAGLKPISRDLSELPNDFKPDQLKEVVQLYDNVTNGAVWQLSSIRSQRIRTKYTDAQANILAMVAYMSKGSVVHYFGDELGMRSSNNRVSNVNLLEPQSIGDMPWDDTAESAKNNFLPFYKNMIALHNAMDGEPGKTTFATDGDIFSFKRVTSKEYAVVVNLSGRKIFYNMHEKLGTPEKGQILGRTPNVPAEEFKINDQITAKNVTIPPLTGFVYGFALNE